MRKGHIIKPLEERFWSKVWKYKEQGACWVWFGGKMRKGYGEIALGGRGTPHISAHRLAWILHNGPIPKGMLVCHHCDNPPCVNPEHLFLGTYSDNMMDLEKKGLSNHPKGEDNHAKLSEEQVQEIRRKYVPNVVTMLQLGKEYGVADETIRKIILRKKWRHLS
jgi:hypothetical protein